MSGSKGGHAAKEEQYHRLMVDFEGVLEDFRNISGVEIGHKVSKKFDSGIEFFILMKLNNYKEHLFSYETAESRDFNHAKLKEKLEMLRAIIV